MCIAIFKPADVHVTRARLRECFDRNDDGAGFMFCDGNGGVEIRKPFFKFREFYGAYRQAVAQYPQSPFGIHFRIATSGEIDKLNAHPHRVWNDMAIIHNGIMPIFVPKGSAESDTVLFVKQVMQTIPTNFNKFTGVVWLLERYMGSSNKVVVLKGDGTHVILNEKSGHWDSGAWYSNHSYKPVVVMTPTNHRTMGMGSDGKYTDCVRPWCRTCLKDLPKGNTDRLCDVCKDYDRLMDEAKHFPRLCKKNAAAVGDRAVSVLCYLEDRASSCARNGMPITADRLRAAIGALLLSMEGVGVVTAAAKKCETKRECTALVPTVGAPSGPTLDDEDDEGGVILNDDDEGSVEKIRQLWMKDYGHGSDM